MNNRKTVRWFEFVRYQCRCAVPLYWLCNFHRSNSEHDLGFEPSLNSAILLVLHTCSKTPVGVDVLPEGYCRVLISFFRFRHFTANAFLLGSRAECHATVSALRPGRIALTLRSDRAVPESITAIWTSALRRLPLLISKSTLPGKGNIAFSIFVRFKPRGPISRSCQDTAFDLGFYHPRSQELCCIRIVCYRFSKSDWFEVHENSSQPHPELCDLLNGYFPQLIRSSSAYVCPVASIFITRSYHFLCQNYWDSG
jgi:hypothetical protein